MLCKTATNTSNTIRTQTGAGRTANATPAVWILIRVIVCLTIAFNYRSQYDMKTNVILTCESGQYISI